MTHWLFQGFEWGYYGQMNQMLLLRAEDIVESHFSIGSGIDNVKDF